MTSQTILSIVVITVGVIDIAAGWTGQRSADVLIQSPTLVTPEVGLTAIGKPASITLTNLPNMSCQPGEVLAYTTEQGRWCAPVLPAIPEVGLPSRLAVSGECAPLPTTWTEAANAGCVRSGTP